mmetsp:Transcript_2920/g.6916  ORF Transcript_2920/g.6916 Transcript_2920/m.6916 type:complete len:738 (-) Transcript_2920:60-2273(-)
MAARASSSPLSASQCTALRAFVRFLGANGHLDAAGVEVQGEDVEACLGAVREFLAGAADAAELEAVFGAFFLSLVDGKHRKSYQKQLKTSLKAALRVCLGAAVFAARVEPLLDSQASRNAVKEANKALASTAPELFAEGGKNDTDPLTDWQVQALFESYWADGDPGKFAVFSLLANVSCRPDDVSHTNLASTTGVEYGPDGCKWYFSPPYSKGRFMPGYLILFSNLHNPLRSWPFALALALAHAKPDGNATAEDVARRPFAKVVGCPTVTETFAKQFKRRVTGLFGADAARLSLYSLRKYHVTQASAQTLYCDVEPYVSQRAGHVQEGLVGQGGKGSKQVRGWRRQGDMNSHYRGHDPLGEVFVAMIAADRHPLGERGDYMLDLAVSRTGGLSQQQHASTPAPATSLAALAQAAFPPHIQQALAPHTLELLAAYLAIGFAKVTDEQRRYFPVQLAGVLGRWNGPLLALLRDQVPLMPPPALGQDYFMAHALGRQPIFRFNPQAETLEECRLVTLHTTRVLVGDGAAAAAPIAMAVKTEPADSLGGSDSDEAGEVLLAVDGDSSDDDSDDGARSMGARLQSLDLEPPPPESGSSNSVSELEVGAAFLADAGKVEALLAACVLSRISSFKSRIQQYLRLWQEPPLDGVPPMGTWPEDQSIAGVLKDAPKSSPKGKLWKRVQTIRTCVERVNQLLGEDHGCTLDELPKVVVARYNAWATSKGVNTIDKPTLECLRSNFLS